MVSSLFHDHGVLLYHTITMPETFPKVQGGGSLILAWQIKGKNVLVVGGGEVNHILPLSHYTLVSLTIR
jgi:hypothetical protein